MKLTKRSFYFLSLTWGLLYTTAGAIIALALILTGHKPKRWGWSWYFEVGKKPWGGAEWGPVFIKDRYSGDSLKNHEFGHAIQNCRYGPLMVPLVSLPSSVRYWFRRIRAKLGMASKTNYDDVWFENQATKLGTRQIDLIREAREKMARSEQL